MPNEITEAAVQSASQNSTALIVLAAVAAVLAVCVAVMAVLLLKKRKAVEAEPEYLLAIGKVHEQGARDYQEDCFAVSEPETINSHGLLAVVSDGMGGLEDGQQVSETAVTAVISEFYELAGDGDTVLRTLLKDANAAVNNLLGPERLFKSGATMVMGLLKNGFFHYISVGDSRICLYRNGQLIRLNREHVFRNELIQRAINGEMSFQEAAEHPKAAGLSSFLGQGSLKHIDMPPRPVAALPGDKFILMSDGVYNALTEAELCSALDLSAEDAAEEIRSAISGKDFLKQDNYTAVIISC